MNLVTARVSPTPGAGGLVSRSGGAVLFVVAREPADDIRRLLDALAVHDQPAPGRLLARAMAALIGADAGTLPDFALVAATSDGLYVKAYGSVEVHLHHDEGDSVLVSGVGSVTGVDRQLAATFPTIVAHPAGDAVPVIDPLLELGRGTMAGDGFTLTWSSSARGGEAVLADVGEDGGGWSAPGEDHGDPKLPFRSQLLGELDLQVVEHLDPLPLPGEPEEQGVEDLMVRGVLCARGHLNDPRSQFCVQDGLRMNHTVELTRGPRPPLGILVFQDGATFGLSRDYVVGRQPDGHPLVREGRARQLVLDDPEQSISREHALIELVGWDVVLVNLSRTNGSYWWDDSAGRWQAIPVGERRMLEPGVRIALGPRTALFESSLRR